MDARMVNKVVTHSTTKGERRESTNHRQPDDHRTAFNSEARWCNGFAVALGSLSAVAACCGGYWDLCGVFCLSRLKGA